MWSAAVWRGEGNSETCAESSALRWPGFVGRRAGGAGRRARFSIYLYIYQRTLVCRNGRRNAQDELWSSPGLRKLISSPSPHPRRRANANSPRSCRTQQNDKFAARSLSRCRPLLLALCLLLLTLHPRPVRTSVTASRTRRRRWHIGFATGVNGLVLCVEVSWFSVLVRDGL